MASWFRRERDELEERLGHRFREPRLLAAALVHRSWANEQGLDEHNERLEFLGDAVLGLLAAEWLYRRHPGEPEGELARRKAWLVSAAPLASRAAELGLGARLRLGVGEERSGGREKASILADAMEAVFGALWLDGGLDAARPAIESFLEHADAAEETAIPDAKTALQERVQVGGGAPPEYSIVEESGPDHDKRFVCEVSIEGRPAGRGEGRSKKEAQQHAAAAALASFQGSSDDSAAGAELGSGPSLAEKAP